MVAVARSVIQVDKDENNDDIRIVKHIKSSLAPKGNDSFFTIDHSGSVMWLSENKVENYTTNEPPEKYPKTKQEIAAEMIKNFLALGPVEATVVEGKLVEV